MSKANTYLSIFIAILILLSLFLFILPRFSNTEYLKEKAQESLTRATGLKVDLKGPLRLSLIPSTKIILDQVALSDPTQGVRLETNSLHLKLSILPLLRKKIVIDDVIVNSFDFELDTSKLKKSKAQGQSNLTEQTKESTPSIPSSSKGFFLRNLKLRNGTLKLKSDNMYKVIQAFQTDISSDQLNKELACTASGVLDGLKLTLSMTTSPLDEIISQKSMKLTANLRITNVMDLSLSGQIDYFDTVFAPNLKLNAQISELSKLLETTGSSAKNLRIKEVRVISDIYYKDKLYHANGEISSKNQNLRFMLTLPKDTDDAVNVSITSDMLNLSEILKDLSENKDKAHSEKAKEIKPEGKNQKDSASKTILTNVAIKRLLIKDQEFSDIRLKGYIKGNTVKLEQGYFRAYGGIGTLKSMYQISPAQSPLRAQINLSSLDVYSILTNLFQNTDITGKLNAELDLKTSLGEAQSPISNNKGSGKLVLSNGVIKKGKTLIEIINFFKALKGQQTELDSISYRLITVPFELQNGKITIKDGTFDSEILVGNFAGFIDLANEFVDIHVQPKESRLLDKKRLISFKIKGNFKDIKVIPEFKEVLQDKARKYLDVDKLKQKLKELNF